MKLSFSRHLLLTLFMVNFPLMAVVDDAAKPNETPPEATAKAAATAPEPVLALPKLEVTAQRVKKIDKDILRLEKQIAREKKTIKSTELDKALNNRQLATAAAIFGGNSVEHISAVAASRVMLMEQERMVLEAMKRPATLEERDLMDKEIEQIRIIRRNLDDAAKQR